MRDASKKLYTIGFIVNIVAIFLAFAVVVGSIVIIIISEDIALEALKNHYTSFDNPNEVRFAGVIALIISIVVLLYVVTALIFAINAKKRLDHGSKKSGSYVQLMIIGLFGDIFYFLSGLFGSLDQEKLPEDFE